MVCDPALAVPGRRERGDISELGQEERGERGTDGRSEQWGRSGGLLPWGGSEGEAGRCGRLGFYRSLQQSPVLSLEPFTSTRGVVLGVIWSLK